METTEQPKRHRKPKSAIDIMAERNQLEARKNAVLEYLAEQIAEFNARLESVGIRAAIRPVAPAPQQIAHTNGHANGVAHNPNVGPCVACGQNGTLVQVRPGLSQYQCPTHRVYFRSQSIGTKEENDARLAGLATDQIVDPVKPQGQPLPPAKMIMHPIEADQAAANTPAGYEEVPDEEGAE